MTSKPDLAFGRSVSTEQMLASLNSVFAIFRMKRGLIAPAHGLARRQPCVIVPLSVEKFDRSIWSGAPSQRWDRVDNSSEATFRSARFAGGLHGVIAGFTAFDGFRVLGGTLLCSTI